MNLRLAAIALSIVLTTPCLAKAQEEAPTQAQTGPVAATLPNPFAPGAQRNPTASVAMVTPPTAHPRAEETLLAIIKGLEQGDLDYALFSDELANSIREQEPVIAPLIRELGTVEDMLFIGQQQGADLFLIRFPEVDTQWLIGFNPDGRVGALLFRPAPAPEADDSESTIEIPETE